MFVVDGISGFVLLGSVIISQCALVTGDHISESVALTFSGVTLEKWQSEGKSALLKSTLANLTTSYCRTHSLACGLSSGSVSVTFLSTNVKFIANYPETSDDNRLRILLFVEIPTANGEDPTARISGTALATIATNGKDQLSSDVGVNTTTVLLGSTLFSEQPKGVIDARMNKIMIPISFMLLFFIALVAWLLHRSDKKKKARRQREIRRNYKSLLNAKKTQINFPEQIAGQNNNSSEIPLTAFRQIGEDSGSALPPQGNVDVKPDVDHTEKRHRRHKKMRQPANDEDPVDNDSADEIGENTAKKPDSELPERLRKSRRRRSRKSSQQEHAGKADMREHDGIERDENEGNTEVNCGYQRDSENEADSAVELSSTAASAKNDRRRDLPQIAQTDEQDNV